MPKDDSVPSLASLRRKTSRRSTPARDAAPSLFSLFDQAAEPEPVMATTEPIRIEPLPKRELKPVVPMAPSAEIEAEPAPPRRPARDLWTVSDLLRDLRTRVERGYGLVSVEGEISNWRPAASGHCYFTLKDAGAQIAAVLFRREAAALRFRPKDGDAVRLRGQLSVYESRGQVQLIAESLEQVGLGAQLAAVQRLKDRLRREGLFDRKRPLPAFPRCIGVITSLHGAALRDIIKVCRRRHAAVKLLVYSVAVQGPNCPTEVVAGLRWFAAHTDRADVILVARGGGSWEDLHGFDDEAVARAIAASPLPVITGIGHAPDSTIADAAADVCAPTPSAAAELLTAAAHRIEDRLERLRERVLRAGRFRLVEAQSRLARLGADAVLRRVEDGLNRRTQRLDELAFRAEAALRRRERSAFSRLDLLEARLRRFNPELRLAENRRRLERLTGRLDACARTVSSARSARLERTAARLGALSPLRVLDRGYALVYLDQPDGTRRLLRSSDEARPGDTLTSRLADGTLRSTVSG